MRFHALATDYDGTIAIHGEVPDRVREALVRLKASGRKLILVTGRELEDLKLVFPEYGIFDLIVAENGAHLFRPSTFEERLLGEPPPEEFMGELKVRGVTRVCQGRVIVATHEPHQDTVLEAIHDLGLEHQVIFNKGAVMVLPPGINKARGLLEALGDLGLSPRNVVAIGDAENDHALLDACECGVAVADALPRLKERASWVTPGGACDGAVELCERLLAEDLAGLDLTRKRFVHLGDREDGQAVKLDPYARGVLLAGTSGGGKTTFATAFLESLSAAGYQYCVLDPEGDYGDLDHAVVLGDAKHAPVPEEAVRILEEPGESVVLCTLAVPFQDRPEFFQTLLPELLELRARTGRPHWIIVDEAHHLVPTARASSLVTMPKDLRGFFLITLEPGHVNQGVLEQMDWMLALGESPEATLADFAKAAGREPAPVPEGALARGELVAWHVARAGDPAFRMKSLTPKAERRRHVRKYSAGELGPDRSFRFRGPDGRLNLRAQNLMIFMQIADGVDDATWMHHLRRGDYSGWFRECIKDEGLAAEARAVEAAEASPEESRAAMRQIIERRYTGPA